MVVGVSLVLFARTNREANADPLAGQRERRPLARGLGIYQCDRFILDGTPEGGAFLTDLLQDPQGIHPRRRRDPHPPVPRLGGWPQRPDADLLRRRRHGGHRQHGDLPDGTVWDEDETTCGDDGEAGQIVLARWNSAEAAANGERPSELITDNFGDVRFRNDREYFTLAFLPPSASTRSRCGPTSSSR